MSNEKMTHCPDCGKPSKVVITSPIAFKMDFRAGFDIGQGEFFDSAQQRDESAARNNLRRIKD